MPISPNPPSFSTISYGKRFSRSSSSATGATSPSAKSRTVRRISSWSSERSKSMRPLVSGRRELDLVLLDRPQRVEVGRHVLVFHGLEHQPHEGAVEHRERRAGGELAPARRGEVHRDARGRAQLTAREAL